MQNEVHEKLIERIGHEVNVKSYPQMFELLYKEMKFKLLKRNPTSEDAIVRLMANHAKKKGWKIVVERKDVIYDVKDFKIISSKSRT